MSPTPVNIRTERHGHFSLWLTPEADAGEILNALVEEGHVLKQSRKRLVQHVGPYVLKSRRDASIIGTLRHTFLGDTYRRGWHVALRLHAAGVCVPTPRALVEKRRYGLITGNILMSDFVADVQPFDEFAAGMANNQAPQQEVQAFLDALRDAYRQVLDAGVYLRDLSGTNVLTKDGRSFYFVDLDDAELGVTYTRKRRTRNHVHLYRQLRTCWPREMLAPFIEDLLPEDEPLDPWMDMLEDEYEQWRARLKKL